MGQSISTYEVSIPTDYTEELRHYIKSMKCKIVSKKKTGLDEALDDIKAGRIYHAQSTDDLMKQILFTDTGTHSDLF